MAKNTYKAQPYESFLSDGYIENNHQYFKDLNGNRRANSMIGVTTSMFVHPAFIDLTPSQRVLYMTAVYQFRNAPDRPSQNREEEIYKAKEYIYLNLKLAKDVLGLYKSNTTFYKDVDALVKHGFIIPVERENHQRTIFKLVPAWKEYEKGCEYTETNLNRHTWEWKRISY